MGVFDFEVPAHATRREWAVYIIVATANGVSKTKFLYVGKVGDNRDGCNPIISRIGNHFSHNKIHSQLKNKISDTTTFNYHVHYSTFGVYDKATHAHNIKKINEIERRLNILVQSEIVDKKDEFELLNIYKGVGVTKKQKEERKKLLSKENIELLAKYIENALKSVIHTDKNQY